MKKFKTLALAAAISVGLATTSAHSAEQHDGLLGGDSSAYFDIFLKYEQVVRIWGLEDVDLDGNEGIGNEPLDAHEFCVFTNNSEDTNEYKITVESENNFQLIGIGGAAVGYTLKVSDELTSSQNTGGGQFITVLNAGPLDDQPNPSVDCPSGEENVKLEIGLSAAVSSETGTYTDRVTMTVEPS